MLVKELFDYTMQLKGECKEFFEETIARFLGEVLIPNLEGQFYVVDVGLFRKGAGEETSKCVITCAFEFFFANEYQHDGREWNVIDDFLKKKGAFLWKAQKDYYRGLRSSYMSVYEVVNVGQNQMIILKSIIEEDQKEILVRQEESKGNNFAKSDIIGARIIKSQKGNILGHGLLVLSEPAVKRIKIALGAILKTLMTSSSLKRMKKEYSDPELMIKKMWVQKIVEIWFYEELKHRKLSQKSVSLS